ncbi:MAG: ornithine decarboxylase [Candidatus Saccharibacteria bacterium]|nr:ornithine decarboxylase [Candidatus Saccharibacteria bacterium]
MAEEEQLQWLHKLRHMNYQTPFMVTDLGIARKNVEALKRLMPRVELFYAIKSNNDPQIVYSIDDLIDGYEIASIGEFNQLKALGVRSDRIIFSNPVKIPGHIEQAYQENVTHFAYDSIAEIKKLAQLAPGAQVYTRLKVPDKSSQFPLSRKFGLSPEQAIEYAMLARDTGLKPVGIAFHVGSQSEESHSWEIAIKLCGHIIRELRKKGIETTIVNIGGGIPAPYTHTDIHLEEIADAINASVDQYIPSDIRIIAEPGRSISASSSVIVTSIIGRETREGGEEWLFLDMGVFQGLIEPLEMPSWRYRIFMRNRKRTGRHIPFVLTGPSCDAYDTIGSNYSLPRTVDVDDQLCIGSTGAYTTVYKSNFNGFEPPKTYYLST